VPTAYDPNRELPQAEFEAMLERDYLSRAHIRRWFPEWEKDDVRYASVDSWQEFHLLVGIHLATDEVRVEYVESRNMNEHAGRVEERARAWMNELSARIDEELVSLSRRVKPSS
jgi:hypothetical protein